MKHEKEFTEQSPSVESHDASSDLEDSGKPSVLDSLTASEGGSFEEHSNRSFVGDQHIDEGLKKVHLKPIALQLVADPPATMVQYPNMPLEEVDNLLVVCSSDGFNCWF